MGCVKLRVFIARIYTLEISQCEFHMRRPWLV
jgi:hypothetical protein